MIQYNIVSETYIAYVDPIMAIVYILLLTWFSGPLIRESCMILLQTIPGTNKIRSCSPVLVTCPP